MAAKRKPTQAITPQPQPIAPRLLNIKQAAAYLGAAVWALRELHWSGKLRGVVIGRRLLWDRADLDKFVDQLKKAA